MNFFGYKENNCSEIQDRHNLFQIYGIIYHIQGLLNSGLDDTVQYDWLFFFDSAYATNLQHSCNPKLDLKVLRILNDMVHQVNLYIIIHRTARKQLRINPNIDVVLIPQIQLVIENHVNKC